MAMAQPSPRHRTLLALLLNLPDRQSIDSALRQIAPDEAPAQWLWNTINSMAKTAAVGSDRTNVLGVSLKEISEEAIKMLLAGHWVNEVSEVIAGNDELVQDARDLCNTLGFLLFLRPLLREEQLTPA